MLSEQILKLVSAVLVTIYIARHLGPNDFGILSYALAIAMVFMAVTRLGMESILVRDIAKYPEQAQEYMSTALSLMLIASAVGLLALTGTVYLIEESNQTRLYILIISTGIIFQPLLVIEYNFQAQVKAKYSSLAKSAALSISATSKIILILLDGELYQFAIMYALDHLIIALTLLAMHIKKRQTTFTNRIKVELIKPLLKSAWPMILAALAATLYMRADQVMIKNMLGAHELGLYAAAIKIYEGWILVPYVLSISLLPAIVKMKSQSEKEYKNNMSMLFSLLIWTSACVAIVATTFGESIINMTYGSEYKSASTVLGIVMWASIFAALGSVTARYLTVEGMERKIATRTFIGLICNILLNLVLIPIYGIEGAAVATLITLFVANYAINYTDKSLKQLIEICNHSIIFRWLKK